MRNVRARNYSCRLNIEDVDAAINRRSRHKAPVRAVCDAVYKVGVRRDGGCARASLGARSGRVSGRRVGRAELKACCLVIPHVIDAPGRRLG